MGIAMDGSALVVLALVLLIYFVPWIVAHNRDHPSTGGIVALNLLLGWTFLGWVIALVWALSGARGAAAPARLNEIDPEANAARRTCPFCAEPVQPSAIKCKHCGSDISATAN
jgi:hypothetical protein